MASEATGRIRVVSRSQPLDLMMQTFYYYEEGNRLDTHAEVMMSREVLKQVAMNLGLIDETNEDGTPVSRFAVDDYFFYTQGVASSMATVLEAVHHDFLITLESRNATELLHHAIVSCQRAAELDPWIILDRDYNSIFANHRANMAAPISHAYFYIRVLIKTLST